MDEDFFDQESEGGSKPMAKEHGEESHEGKTAMLNSEVCPGKQVGDTMTMRVVAVHDQEYEVEECGEDEDEEEAPKEDKAEMPKGMGGGGDSEYASMYE